MNPTTEQMANSRLDLLLAGTEDAVMMIEGYGDFLSVDEMITAIAAGHAAVASVCRELSKWAAEVGKAKATERLLTAPDGIYESVKAAVGDELAVAMAIGKKQIRGAAVERLRSKAIEMVSGLDKENAAYKVQRRQNQIGSSVGRSVGRSRIAPASLPSYRLRPRSRSRAFDIALTEWPPSRRAKARLLRVRPNCRVRTCTRC